VSIGSLFSFASVRSAFSAPSGNTA
jgi:hypothetical protein